LGLFGESFVPADPVDGESTSLVAAQRDFTAERRVNEGPCDSVKYRVFADFSLPQCAGANETGAVRGDADAPMLLEQLDAEAGAGEIAGGP